MTAYHEGGHAMVSAKLPHTDPVHRVSIVSRGLALGFTETPPLADKYQHTETELLERIATMMGGRAAEEVVFGEFTAGASSDLAQATLLARRMVEELGMSELGPVSFAAGERAWFGVMGEAQSWSNEMSSKVDAEVKKILDGAYEVAKKIVLAQRKRLDKVAEALLEKETLDGDEFAKLIA